MIERLETMIIYTRVPLQISKLQTQPKSVSGSRDPINQDHVFIGDDVENMDFRKSPS